MFFRFIVGSFWEKPTTTNRYVIVVGSLYTFYDFSTKGELNSFENLDLISKKYQYRRK
jgi:hypothetical protein